MAGCVITYLDTNVQGFMGTDHSAGLAFNFCLEIEFQKKTSVGFAGLIALPCSAIEHLLLCRALPLLSRMGFVQIYF